MKKLLVVVSFLVLTVALAMPAQAQAFCNKAGDVNSLLGQTGNQAASFLSNTTTGCNQWTGLCKQLASLGLTTNCGNQGSCPTSPANGSGDQGSCPTSLANGIGNQGSCPFSQ
jgi:hypothetical protein